MVLFVCSRMLNKRILLSTNRLKRLSPFVHRRKFSQVVEKDFKKVLVANRGEPAVRIFRALNEMGKASVAIYSELDKISSHRTKADESYMISKGMDPVEAYMNIEEIIEVAKANNVDAIHPGYGYLSERVDFVKACEENGITFIGPSADAMAKVVEKTSAKMEAIAAGLPVIPGSETPVRSAMEARQFVAKFGTPVFMKPARGGGGRGLMRIDSIEEVENAFQRCSYEALKSFGDRSLYVEKFIDHPRVIQIQIMGDHYGDVIHLYDRDCSIQKGRRKVIEFAPAHNLDPKIRDHLLNDAIKLAKHVKYYSAGTVEFLVDIYGDYYFMEMNSELEAEHALTEEMTGLDLVQAQIQIAEGKRLKNIPHFQQEKISPIGAAIQCRITAEDPVRNFAPDEDMIELFRSGGGAGIRLDSPEAFSGSTIAICYDAALMKIVARSRTHEEAVRKMIRALREFRVRGIKTNIPFLLNVLSSEGFLNSAVHTSYLIEHPELTIYEESRNRGQKLLAYLADIIVNGPNIKLYSHLPSSTTEATVPFTPNVPPPDGFREILKKGPEAFVKAIRAFKGCLISDTTLRDANQCLLAGRVRTWDMERIAPYVAHNLSKLYSLEMWGGGIFEQSIQYLRECPWERLERLRKKIPNIPFQMLLRGSNTVGYACNPDNVVARFCELAVQYGIDIFRIFDSLNYYPNMRITMDAVGNAGGIIEAAMAYTGDVCNKDSDMYNLEYYMNLADQFIRGGAHILTIKDMAGLLRPKAGRILIDALRQRYPDIPIHVHTHDTAGVAVACMLACAEAGADIIDCSVDSMSGMTSQPSMGAMVACLDGSSIETGLSPTGVSKYSTYWQMTRQQYASFDCTVFLKSGSADVFEHQMPGAQYSWSQFQAYSLGLVDYFEAYKKKYKEADTVLGCIPKVSPSSRVVRELARFMLEHKLTPESLRQKIDQLTLPASVVSFFKGEIGQPPYGFPEPLRTYILREKKRTSYHRPGSHLPPLEFGLLRKQLQRRHNKTFRAIDLVSAAIMPTEFDEFERFRQKYGPTSRIPTKVFFEGLSLGESVDIEIETGKTLYIRYLASGSLDKRGYRHLYFELNGQIRVIPVFDRKATMNKIERVQANKEDIGSVGSPVSGEITDIKVRIGEKVKLQQPLFTVRANENIESVAEAPCAGYVSKICCKLADTVEANDLVVIIKSQDTEVQHYDDE